MISKLPKWVESGAFILSFVAGYINSIGLLGFEHKAVSHLSGTATLLGINLINDTLASTFHILLILLSFLVGATLSGFLIRSSALKLGRHYDTALFLEAVLILISIPLLSKNNFIGHYVISAACGLQNALATSYSGAIIRTTHLTGIFTDLGILIGAKLRGEVFDKRKFFLFLLIISGFIFGGSSGAYFYYQFQFLSLFLPTLICVFIAFSYRIYSQKSVNCT
ncbi:YoaK family protein [Colwellia sp. 1_MG-2023]|uniref:YoaK family protein n=1 Tax=Colwellia sp. 1_MG-2023 TaxID=3062649 RepID=UPI0026E2F3EA|nr:YoaK family protein [Colwellia sp. 1_MG-2023]MDO6446850.1 YoaK family protein [Colwellia sp. 1_MG-2023]